MRWCLVLVGLVGVSLCLGATKIAECHSDNGDKAEIFMEKNQYLLSFLSGDEASPLEIEKQKAYMEYADCAARLRFYAGGGPALVDILIKDPKGISCVQPGADLPNTFAIFSVWDGSPGYISSYATCDLFPELGSSDR